MTPAEQAVYTLLTWLAGASLIGIAVVVLLILFLRTANRSNRERKR